MSLHRIALVTCSTRQPRLNPYITDYVSSIVTKLPSNDVEIALVDIADQNLPLFDESILPARLPKDNPTPHYTKSHAKSWSAVVKAFDAFVFVTCQYNWSVPASLKNALDFLFHEFSGKPAAIVSYGGRGGTKSAAHLRDILNGLRMNVMETNVAIVLPSVDLIDQAKEIGKVPETAVEKWKEDGVEGSLEKLWSELISAPSKGESK